MKKNKTKSKNKTGIDSLVKEMRVGFKEMRVRFEGIDKKFDGIDKKFDGIDKKFDGIDKKFDGIDKKFDGIDKKFDGIDKKFEGIDKKFYELYNFLQKHMVTKDEFNRILGNYATKNDLQQFSDEMMDTLDKIVGDYNTDKQEHATFILHLERLAEMEIKIGKMDKEMNEIKNIILKDARFSRSR